MQCMIKLPARVLPETATASENANDDHSCRIFCPDDLRVQLVDMVELHFCAHPLIPGYAAPSAPGIRHWAVKQMYDFCVANDLREAWAYLWENWYRKGRWELWARCEYERIPRLKTTMILPWTAGGGLRKTFCTIFISRVLTFLSGFL